MVGQPDRRGLDGKKPVVGTLDLPHSCHDSQEKHLSYEEGYYCI